MTPKLGARQVAYFQRVTQIGETAAAKAKSYEPYTDGDKEQTKDVGTALRMFGTK
jgi:hypothetical protein